MSGHEELAVGAGLRREEGDLDAVAGRVIAELVSRSHLMGPAEVSTALTQAALGPFRRAGQSPGRELTARTWPRTSCRRPRPPPGPR